MLLGHYAIDKTFDEHVREIADIAGDPQTLIFFDTNILSYLFKLHEAARSEFFAWSDSVLAENRLVIPAWAANEYLSRVTAKKLDSYTPRSKEHTQATKLLNSLFETASLFVDDTSLRRINYTSDRASFIAEFRSAIDALTPLMKVFSQEFDSGVIHQQIVDHLSESILDSDLAALCARATKESAGRFEHRLPPGFRDADKTENRLGDLIIWFEILNKSSLSSASFTKALFVTRDEKNDWVYAPQKRIELVRGIRKPVNNGHPEIKLADPRLVTEFRCSAGHANLAIASFDTLVEGLSKASPELFTHLAAAIQINIEESASVVVADEPETSITGQSADNLAEITHMPENEPPEPAEPDHPRLVYEQSALRDREYLVDAPSPINDIIRDLKSLNWYTQNPAIVMVRTIRHDEFPQSSWFVLGRNIYQAACGNSQKAMEFIADLESQLRQFPPETAQHLLAGMLFEIYFDSRGEFRADIKFSYADKPLSVVTRDGYGDVLAFINYHLRSHRDHLAFIPGDQVRKTIHITSTLPHSEEGAFSLTGDSPTFEIRSVLLDGQEFLCDSNEVNDDAWYRMLQKPKVSPERIRDRISDELAIPKWALSIETEPSISINEQLAMPKDHGVLPRLAT